MFEDLRVPKESSSGCKPKKATEKAVENNPISKITRLAQMKKISVFTASRMIKKMERKSLRCSRKPLLSGAMVQNRLVRSVVC